MKPLDFGMVLLHTKLLRASAAIITPQTTPTRHFGARHAKHAAFLGQAFLAFLDRAPKAKRVLNAFLADRNAFLCNTVQKACVPEPCPTHTRQSNHWKFP